MNAPALIVPGQDPVSLQSCTISQCEELYEQLSEKLMIAYSIGNSGIIDQLRYFLQLTEDRITEDERARSLTQLKIDSGIEKAPASKPKPYGSVSILDDTDD